MMKLIESVFLQLTWYSFLAGRTYFNSSSFSRSVNKVLIQVISYVVETPYNLVGFRFVSWYLRSS